MINFPQDKEIHNFWITVSDFLVLVNGGISLLYTHMQK
jgi:hypothetical protein